jgi:hypothetical protein
MFDELIKGGAGLDLQSHTAALKDFGVEANVIDRPMEGVGPCRISKM